MQTIVTPLLESAIFLPRKASAPHGMKFIQNTPQVQSLQSCGRGTGKTTCATGDIWIFYCSQAHSWTIKLTRSVIEITAIETSDTSLCIHPLNRMAATKFTHGAIYKTPFFYNYISITLQISSPLWVWIHQTVAFFIAHFWVLIFIFAPHWCDHFTH